MSKNEASNPVDGQGRNVEPPSNNMGVETPTVGVHWLSVTWHYHELDSVKVELSQLLGVKSEEWREVEGGHHGYDRRAVGPFGARLMWGTKRNDIHAVLPGQACEAVSFRAMRRYFKSLLDRKRFCVGMAGVEVTRVDVAMDVAASQVPNLHDLYREMASSKRTWRSYFQSVEFQDNKHGSTIYVGSRKGDRFLRIYNRRGPVRFELQSRNAHAWSVVKALSLAGETAIPGVIRGAVEWIEPTESATHRERAPLSAWWAAIAGSFHRVRVALPCRTCTVDTVRRWLANSVAPSLAMLERLNPGGFWLADLVTNGLERLSDRHERMIGDYRLAVAEGLR